MVFWKSENYLSSINLTIWFEQVGGSDIHQVSHSGFIVDRPAVDNQVRSGFTVSAPKVEARNLNIAAAKGSSKLHQAMIKLSPQQRSAAKALHVQELADILFENRMQVPKKPVLVSHLRQHQWVHGLVSVESSIAE